MSKTGQWVFEMQEDAQDCTRAEFVKKHGAYQAVVWDEVQDEMNGESVDPESYWGSFSMEMDDGA
jgi:hypothetical protein|tara:strand:- start:25 stop:219 length:195 start_codon:yes stop_codon:yes gene_type:complete